MLTTNFRVWIAMLSGFAAGMMFIIACPSPEGDTTASTSVGSGAETFGPTTASAATTGGGVASTCQNWQVRYDPAPADYGAVVDVPTGWEPFGASNAVWSRRCAD